MSFKKVTLKDEKILDNWSILIENGQGKTDEIYQSTVNFIKESRAPGLNIGMTGMGFYLTKKIGLVLEMPWEEILEEPVSTKSEEVSPTEIDTSEWKTYKNMKYGIEIKIPKKVKIIEKAKEDFYLITFNTCANGCNPYKGENMRSILL